MLRWRALIAIEARELKCQRGCAIKWFKHESKARNDERISKLEDKASLEGYGFYFKMLELVAENMDSSDKCEMTYSISRWGRQTNISSKKVVFLLQCCHDVGLMIVQRVNDDITVKIPNLLKYRDNHTKNLQATSKQELEKELELDKELKLEKEKPIIADKSRNGKKEKIETELQIACRETWAKYSNSYYLKYGANPVRNAKINSHVKSFVTKLGFEESPKVAAWFLSHTTNLYCQGGHGFNLLDKDAEKLRTEWFTGNNLSGQKNGNKFLQKDNELAEYNRLTKEAVKAKLFGTNNEKDITDESERL